MPAIALTGSVEITRRARTWSPPAQVTIAPPAVCATLVTVAPSRIWPATSAAIAAVNPLIPPMTR
jgi:hypothetical protein